MKIYETRFASSLVAAEALGLEGFEVKSSHTNSVGQPVIIMQREISEHHEPEEWPPIDHTAMVVASKALEKAAMQ